MLPNITFNYISTNSYFIDSYFTVKSLPIVVLYFRWWMLEDNLTFKLSDLAPLKGKKMKT